MKRGRPETVRAFCTHKNSNVLSSRVWSSASLGAAGALGSFWELTTNWIVVFVDMIPSGVTCTGAVVPLTGALLTGAGVVAVAVGAGAGVGGGGGTGILPSIESAEVGDALPLTLLAPLLALLAPLLDPLALPDPL